MAEFFAFFRACWDGLSIPVSIYGFTFTFADAFVYIGFVGLVIKIIGRFVMEW